MKVKKMWMDGLPSNNPPETTRLNKNILITKEFGSVVNEDGFDKVLDLPDGMIGRIRMSNNRVVVFFHKSSGTSPDEIGIIDLQSNIYTPTLRADLNFSSKIKGFHSKEFNNDDIIVFWDDNSQPRILNLTNLPFTLDVNLTPTDLTKLDLINLFPSKQYVNYNLLDVSSGGSLSTGVYYFSLEYELPDGTLTDAINISNPITIIKDGLSQAATLADGDIGNTQTDKSIKLQITNLDLKYKHFKLVVIHKINGITQAFRLNTKFSTTNSTIVYKGSESKAETSLSSLLVKSPLISKIEDGTVLDDEFIMGNIVERPKLNLQSVANNIVSKWVVEDSVNLPFNFNGTTVTTKSNAENTFKDSTVIFNKKGFQSFEVYALYITGIYKDGSKTEAFHIPGRDALSSERTALDTDFDKPEIAVNANGKKFHFNDFSVNDGTMGFWENDNEVYPEGFPDLAGQKVRHHRFPSIANLQSWVDFYKTNDGTNSITKVLGLRLENIIIPTDIKEQLQGIEISYAKRTIDNQTILGESLMIPLNWEDGYNPDENYTKLRFHNFDLLKYKPSVIPSHFSSQLELNKVETSSEITSIRASYINTNQIKDLVYPLQNVKYIPNNNTADVDYNNQYREEFLYAERKDLGNSYGWEKPSAVNRRFFGYLSLYRTDIYTNFYEQELVSTGYIHILDGSSDTVIPKLYGGDTFKSLYYYRVIPPLEGASYQGVEFGCIVESPSNLELRYEGTNWWETYYPKLFVDNPASHSNVPYTDTHEIPNWLGYNNDYSSVNDLAYNFPANPFDKTINIFPNRVMKSLRNNRETLEFNWRKFLVNDYYETRREYGDIKALATYDGKLLIHLEDALLITVTTDRLKTGELEVSLGTGNIFEREPDIVVDNESGYAGIYNKFDNDVNLLGYTWVDRKSKSVFIFNNKLDKISSKGLNNFFNESISLNDEYRIVYEERFNRLFISQLGKYTMSYNQDVDGWVAEHTFIGDFYLSIRNEAYSFKNYSNKTQLYKHSVPNNKGLYYEDESGERTHYPSFITPVYNQGGEKLLQSIAWVADVYSLNKVLKNESFTDAIVLNNNQSSGDIELIVFPEEDYNIRKIREYWTFNRFRDYVNDYNLPFIDSSFNSINSNIDYNKEFFLRAKFMSTYFIVKLTFDNAKIGNYQDEIVFNDIQFNVSELIR